MPIEAEILRSMIEVERKATDLKILRLQKDLGQCHYNTKIFRNEIHKKDQKYDLLLEDFKNLGIENEKLKGWMKAKQAIPEKRSRLKRSKSVKDLQKEVDEIGRASCRERV